MLKAGKGSLFEFDGAGVCTEAECKLVPGRGLAVTLTCERV